MQDLNALLAKLVSFASVSPLDMGCQEFMITFLQQLGFECQRFDNPPVSNFFARFGNKNPLLLFAGHTDVVDAGELAQWDSPPFVLQEREGFLYGRGTADMKGSLAAMLLMAAEFTQKNPHFSGSLGFLITSGEEGDDFALGTPYVMAELQKRGIHPDYCIVGEPSSSERVGDVLKIGRRGSLTGRVIIEGKQGHVAYPHLAENPIHTLCPALLDLTTHRWDEGNAHFPPTTLQVTQIKAGGQGSNIIPGQLLLHFNIRFSTEQTAEGLKQAIEACFLKHHLKAKIEWKLNGEPFLTAKGRLLEACKQAIGQLTDHTPLLSTSGGTSDGRFIAPYGVEVVELGPVNATIHQVNECIASPDLETLYRLYLQISNILLLD